MLKIIIPFGGSSELFSSAGYFYPKPLIEIAGKTMVELVLENPAKAGLDCKFIFIVKEEDIIKFHLDNTLRLLNPDCEIVVLKNSTKGALCSVLMAIDKYDKDDSLLILNGDQIIDYDFSKFLDFWKNNDADCGLVTFNSIHPRWSYARVDQNHLVLQTAEKNPISSNAIAGYYYFSNRDLFLMAAFQSIKDSSDSNESYFLSPVVNQLILMNKKICSYQIDSNLYHSFYSPHMLKEYERKLK
jgi:NDP-sugar pyrophosphorylase family protein